MRACILASKVLSNEHKRMLLHKISAYLRRGYIRKKSIKWKWQNLRNAKRSWYPWFLECNVSCLRQVSSLVVTWYTQRDDCTRLMVVTTFRWFYNQCCNIYSVHTLYPRPWFLLQKCVSVLFSTAHIVGQTVLEQLSVSSKSGLDNTHKRVDCSSYAVYKFFKHSVGLDFKL